MQICTILLTAATFATAIFLGTAAIAADIPKQGSDTFTAFWVVTSSNTIKQGNRTLMTYEVDGVTHNDGGGPMFHLFAQRCLGVYESLGGGDRNDLGTCSYTDKDGDQIFEHYPVGKVVNGHGSAELIGGTGKYAGISGTIEFTEGPGIKADDKMFRNAELQKATWKLP